ncbi:hypothetical protein CMU93_14145 [Elizabethkingia anophelis]|uniref:hypothetical protein n=1 Tax=Elizabethkingia anophelis TaxID=1117645 RepID=UPI00099AF244|nr:hypothetical protein [Elizabethkingia anophelis]MDV2448641.1 hypothetical protein [Elizabethkingia anophelis]OPC33114.1 hypothetical protein BAX98_04545 [Elizabethkingia anophelis]
MKGKLKNYAIQFIKEIIPVIAGILIALFIDNWNSERKDKAYVNQIFSTINSELNESKEDIKDIIPKQKSLIDSLEFHANNKNITIQDVVMKSKGIYIPQIKLNAWKSVSGSKIDLIDYKKVIRLSHIEEQKQTLTNKSDFLMTFLYNNINETDKNKKQTMKMILMDIVQTEKSIQDGIKLFQKG